MIKKSLLLWLTIIPLAILNGALRQFVLDPLLGMTYAKPVSGLILCALIFFVSFLFIPRLGKGTGKTYGLMGFVWAFLTVIFETVLGLALGSSFSEIIGAYNITTGNLWLAVVLFTGIAPWLTAKIRRII
ncbi:hypothetical protein [Breznakiella homolactica]|uniref:Uncharacterized protein n=1 Tax=Breznakiella homolactica TaxID=2798577 RepID=A0A7T8B7P9_9SPIR|nr:hypothetical protein [Breznakiella homolactica]QQO07744.1 hypothetical protein JFL75_12405 [Breznakiella homolactica]